MFPMLRTLDFPSTTDLLVSGGDSRIALLTDAVNQYGCSVMPDPSLLAFGSSTASVISEYALDACDALRERIMLDEQSTSPLVTYASELERMRNTLIDLGGLSDLQDLSIIFSASGTDIHLIAGQLMGGSVFSSTTVITIEAAETGSGIPLALNGHHFCRNISGEKNEYSDKTISHAAETEIRSVAVRLCDGSLRNEEDIDHEVESIVDASVKSGKKVLLVLTDMSKTGLIFPNISCAISLHARFPDFVNVLVDACQFRISYATLHAYLSHGFMVALTGSKFLSGPTFSGALIIPHAVKETISHKPLPLELRSHSQQADWPLSWKPASILNNFTNFGMLLRWEAALTELRLFNSLHENDIKAFLYTFSEVIKNRLQNDPIFELVETRELNRSELHKDLTNNKNNDNDWDMLPSIFSFTLFHRVQDTASSVPLDREQTLQIYRLLLNDSVKLTNPIKGNYSDISLEISKLRCQLGQPVPCGVKIVDGKKIPVSALRLCISSRLIAEALIHKNSDDIIQSALKVLDKVSLLVHHLGSLVH